MRRVSIIVAMLAIATFSSNAQEKSIVKDLLPPLGQMPTNEEKQYEYYGEIATERTGSGDIEKRIQAWFKSEAFADAKVVEQEVEETDGDYMKLKVTQPLVESHFSVKRTHTNRAVDYMIKFKFERKEFEYWINEINYKAKEEYPKGVEEFHVALEEFKSPTAISVREELDQYFRDLIQEAELVANTEVAQLVAPEPMKVDQPEEEDQPEEKTESPE